MMFFEVQLKSTLFNPVPGARQVFGVTVDLVQTSCGMAVSLFDFIEDRQQLNQWVSRKGDAGIKEYWLEKNRVSLDGKPTHIKNKNT